jgi:hypothetical protein
LIYATFDFGLAAFFLFWTHIIVGWTYGDEAGRSREVEARLESGGDTRSES